MGIQIQDVHILKQIRDQFVSGNSCAILGDCYYYYNNNNSQEFQSSMRLSTLDTFDIAGNPTHKLDLQEPIEEKFKNKYDLIIDAGTLYCCFDINAVWTNLFDMLTDDGVIVHLTNLSGHYGRAFYSLHPALFYDLYRTNEFQFLTSAYRIKFHNGDYIPFEISKNYLLDVTEREFHFSDSAKLTQYVHSDSMLLCAVKRARRQPFRKPIPSHFTKTEGK